MGLQHNIYGTLAIEFPSIDLSSNIRIRHFFKNSTVYTHIALLLIGKKKDIEHYCRFFLNRYPHSSSMHLLFADIESIYHSVPAPIYQIREGKIASPILLECDEFDEQLHIRHKEEYDLWNIDFSKDWKKPFPRIDIFLWKANIFSTVYAPFSSFLLLYILSFCSSAFTG